MENLQFQKWEKYLPDYVNLKYIDYGDDLCGEIELLQNAVSENSFAEISDELSEQWEYAMIDAHAEYMNYIREHMLRDGLSEEFFLKNEEGISDAIYELDSSTPFEDLLRNTPPNIMFYSLGVDIEGLDYCGRRQSSVKMEVYKIRRALKLRTREYDDILAEMVENSSYGGELRLYFTASLKHVITSSDYDWNTISLSGGAVAVAIVHSGNGSGDHCKIPLNITLPFNRGNLFIDKAVSYSYTYEICGMVESWCEGTDLQFGLSSKVRRNMPTSSTGERMRIDRMADETYKNGGCTPGDMKIGRHRDVSYINSFPCGNKCPHCGTFWID